MRVGVSFPPSGGAVATLETRAPSARKLKGLLLVRSSSAAPPKVLTSHAAMHEPYAESARVSYRNGGLGSLGMIFQL